MVNLVLSSGLAGMLSNQPEIRESDHDNIDSENIPNAAQASPPAVRQHPMQTRLRNNILQPKEFADGTVRYSVNARFSAEVTEEIPTTTLLSSVKS